MQLDEIIAHIRVKHRRHCHAMESRKIMQLRACALRRQELGWSRNLPEAERERINREAAKLVEQDRKHMMTQLRIQFGLDKKLKAAERKRLTAMVKELISPFKAMEDSAEKEREDLAKLLPVWETFGKNVRGFGESSLAVIVAEAGDLSNLTEAQLWKRMGLAPGQNRVPPGLSAEQRRAAWIERGYSPRRRSRMWNIGDALIKLNQGGVYRAAYLRRKAYELARDPDMTKMHAHRRAQRYMEKRLLRDLWRAWRRTTEVLPDGPRDKCPPPSPQA